MPSDKRIFVNPNGGAWKGGMDKDSELHYVQNGYYRDARNISFMVNGDRFTVKNLKGNTSKSYTLNSGANTCIGSFDDKGNETVYYFIYNGSGDHEVLKYQYNSTVDAISQVAEGAGFAFEVDKLITSIVVVNDRFLMWGQEGQEIGCIDLDNPPAAAISTAADRWELELNKIPDPEPLQCFYLQDDSRTQNTLKKAKYQFRYVYIYEGGFRSPFSTISQVPVPDLISTGSTAADNTISVVVPRPTFDKVTRVDLYVRYANNDSTKDANLWYKFGEIPYDEFSNSQTTISYAFTGSEALEPADPAEALTETTFFPKSVNSVVFLPSNVLGFLNFQDGLDISAVEPKVTITPQYNARPLVKGTVTTVATYSSSSTVSVTTLYNPKHNIQLTTTAYETVTISGTLRVGDTVRISLVLFYQETSGISNPAGISASAGTTTETFEIYYVVKEDDTTSDNVAANIANVINAIDTRYVGFGGIVATSSSNTVRIFEGTNQRNTPYTVATTINSASTTASVTVDYPSSASAQQWIIRRTEKSFKRNAEHPFGIVYADGKGRRSKVIPVGSAFVEGQDSTLSTNKDWVDMQITIGHLAPSWAKYYYIVYAKNQTVESFLQIPCQVQNEGNGIWNARVFEQLNYFYDEYEDSTGDLAGYNYAYATGDRIRLLGDINNITLNEFSTQEDLPINDSDVNGVLFQPSILSDGATGPFTSTSFLGSTITRPSGSWITDGYQIGQRVIIENANTPTNNRTVNITNVTALVLTVSATLTTDAADNTATFTHTEKTLVEVYRPKTESTRLYYEIGYIGTIDSNLYHSGNTQDQGASQAAIIDLTNHGDVYNTYLPALVNNTINNISGVDSFIECQSMYPVDNALVTDIGRPNVETERDDYDDKVIQRGTSITWTQPIVSDSPTNGLSIVLPTSIYNDFGSDFGSIQKAFLQQDRKLVIYFEDKVGYMGVFAELQKSPTGEISYATDALANQINYYAYDGGIGLNPESFAYYDTIQYFLSPRNNAVCRLANDGITEISKYGMASWFNENLDVKSNNLSGLITPAVYDERNESYVLSFRQQFNLTYVDVNPETNYGFIFTPDISGSYGEDLVQVGDTIVVTDTASPANSYTITLTGVSYNSSNGQFTVAYSDTGTPIGSNIASAFFIRQVETVMFNEPANAWVSFLDLDTEYMCTCGVDYVSFRNGALWLHNVNSTYSSFYGSGVTAEVTIPFNIEPSAMKVFMNIEQETNDAWLSETDGDVSTPAGQTSQIFDEWYEQKQPNQFSAWIGKDTSTPTALVPTNKVFEGFDLRDTALQIRLTQDASTESKLRTVTVNFKGSNLSS